MSVELKVRHIKDEEEEEIWNSRQQSLVAQNKATFFLWISQVVSDCNDFWNILKLFMCTCKWTFSRTWSQRSNGQCNYWMWLSRHQPSLHEVCHNSRWFSSRGISWQCLYSIVPFHGPLLVLVLKLAWSLNNRYDQCYWTCSEIWIPAWILCLPFIISSVKKTEQQKI